jgi:hypothetical protein
MTTTGNAVCEAKRCDETKIQLLETLHASTGQGTQNVLFSFSAGLSNAAPAIYFPGALFYSAGFNVNRNFKEKIFLNNSMFQFFFS